MNDHQIKEIVKEKYSLLAEKNFKKTKSCCAGKQEVYTIMADEYNSLDGYVPEADLGLGCGLPTEFAEIKSGDTVLDLGSGAGNDVFIARRVVGENGKVIGVDFTQAMVDKANVNKQKLGYVNVEFKLGEIEELPIEGSSVDVVISNCVLNLVPNKEKAFQEIHRVLKSSGHLCVSDIVLRGELPHKLRQSAEMYAGCVAGALQKEEYLEVVNAVGFKNIQIRKEKEITVPKEILKNYLTEEEITNYQKSDFKILSITVFAVK
ncbi:MAG: arsenite methyltransferase [Bacteroidetes bacterium]|nr:arsenite methyltransferase [Bacteroidota bacterium]MBU2585342.1 arsenite methyltransferase [Bacteroidota bacterium]